MEPFVLKGRQRAVEVALGRKSAVLVSYYVGALHALATESNPDRLAHAAHGLRELIEKFPTYVDVAMPAHSEKMGPKVNDLEDAWNRVMAKTKCRGPDGKWNGALDAVLSGFLTAVEAFFSWKREHVPRRRAEVERALVKIDAARRPLPARLQKRNVDLWIDVREFFQGVAHHSTKCTDEEFGGYLETLELFLLERLEPRTFDDFSEIDSIFADAAKSSDKGDAS